MKLIKNVTIYTMNENNEVIDQGQMLINDNQIIELGQRVDAPNNDQLQVIDGQGAVVTPGLIDIHTHVGIWGETTGDSGDGNEASSPYTPLMHAIDAINPQHISFNDARSGGVTTVQTGAGSGNPIGGVWSILKTSGKVVEDMILVKRSGLKGALGENPKGLYGQRQQKSPYSRMSTAQWIRRGFEQAKRSMQQGEVDHDELILNGEHHLIPFIDVLQNQMPLRLHAHRADDIVTAIRIAKEFGVDLSIEHCTEGFKIAEYIAESGYPVTLGPFMGAATKYEVRDMNVENPKLLRQRGILTAIITDHPFVPIQYLYVCAAEAVKHGMDEMEALRAITIHPAKIGRIDEQVGSLEKGKDADFVLWSHHPFSMKANVLSTWINGHCVYEKA